jgi:hypothetical protein
VCRPCACVMVMCVMTVMWMRCLRRPKQGRERERKGSAAACCLGLAVRLGYPEKKTKSREIKLEICGLFAVCKKKGERELE